MVALPCWVSHRSPELVHLLICWKTAGCFHILCKDGRDDREDICPRPCEKEPLFPGGEARDRLAVDVGDGDAHRFFSFGLDIEGFFHQSRAGTVGDPIWPEHLVSMVHGLLGRGDFNVRGAPRRWVNERPRDQRYAAINSQWLGQCNLFLCRWDRHGKTSLSLREGT